MYLSFIEEEKTQLSRRMEMLDELEEQLESKCDDIISELKMTMQEQISEAIYEAFEEAGIEDNYYNEKTTEAADEMTQYVEQNL